MKREIIEKRLPLYHQNYSRIIFEKLVIYYKNNVSLINLQNLRIFTFDSIKIYPFFCNLKKSEREIYNIIISIFQTVRIKSDKKIFLRTKVNQVGYKYCNKKRI